MAGKKKRVPAAVEIDSISRRSEAKVGAQLKDALDTQSTQVQSHELVKAIKDAEEGAARGRRRCREEVQQVLRAAARTDLPRPGADEHIRPDHRAFDEIRPISIELACCRGARSALFTRGETQGCVRDTGTTTTRSA